MTTEPPEASTPPPKKAPKIVVPIRVSPSKVALAQVLAERRGTKYTTLMGEAVEAAALAEFGRLSSVDQQKVRAAAAVKLTALEKKK